MADIPWTTSLRSLRMRLPAQMLALVSIVLALFMTVAYRLLETTLVDAGKTRAAAVAAQIADLMRQSTQMRMAEAQRFARDASVRSYLRQPGEEGDTRAVRERLTSLLAAAGQPTVELWSAGGTRLLTVAGRAAPGGVSEPAAAEPPRAGVGAFRESRGVISFDVVADVMDVPPGDGQTSGAVRGRVVVRRSFSSVPTSEGLRQLLGGGAVVKLGNQAGGVWTDLVKVVEAPPRAAASGGAAYTLPDGSRRLGANVLIVGTPWAVVVEFPRDVVVAP